jgi:hypothetical protein
MKEFLYEAYGFFNGRIPKLEMTLLWFPNFFHKYIETYKILFYGAGPLDLNQRF